MTASCKARINNSLPPIAVKGRSQISSPVVVRGKICTSSPKRRKAMATFSACWRARALLRVAKTNGRCFFHRPQSSSTAAAKTAAAVRHRRRLWRKARKAFSLSCLFLNSRNKARATGGKSCATASQSGICRRNNFKVLRTPYCLDAHFPKTAWRYPTN